MARGTAKLFGFDIMINFRLPFFAKNPSDFLATVAYKPLNMAEGLSLYPAGRQQGEQPVYLAKSHDHHDSWRSLARCGPGLLYCGAFSHGILLVSHRLAAPLLNRWTGQGVYLERHESNDNVSIHGSGMAYFSFGKYFSA